jgi:hypothetical protein
LLCISGGREKEAEQKRDRIGAATADQSRLVREVVEPLTVFCLLIASVQEKKTKRGYSWLLVLSIGGRGKGRGVVSGFACSWGRN